MSWLGAWAAGIAHWFGRVRHRAAVWWSVPPHAATTAFVSLLLLTALGFFVIQKQSRASDKQFCQLFADTSQGQIHQYQQTVAYLASPAGSKRTPLNETIRRISLPDLKRTIRARAESFPDVCRQFGSPPTIPLAAAPIQLLLQAD